VEDTLPSFLASIGFECQQCGKCCEWGGSSLSASEEDLERWERENRQDILDYISYITVEICPICEKGVLTEDKKCVKCGVEAERKIFCMDLWFDYSTGRELERCPFLRKVRNKDEYRCRINDTKPQRCKVFPVYVALECYKCDLNLVKHFKDTELKDMPLEEFFRWSKDDFYFNVLKNVKTCPSCGEPLPEYTVDEWAQENCPATKFFIKSKPVIS
jgi:Fe-S-cluster containining protein